MDVDTKLCLICEHRTITKTDNRLLFETLVRLLKIDKFEKSEIIDWKWDAHFENSYNFCNICREDIALLSTYENDLGKIRKEVKEFNFKIKTLILKSNSESKFQGTIPGPHINNQIQQFRRSAVEDWDPTVSLSCCHQGNDIPPQTDDKIVEIKVVPLTNEEMDHFLLRVDNKFKCKICFAVLNDRKNGTHHVDVVHRNVKRFRCKRCNTLFSTRSSAREHIKKRHNYIAVATQKTDEKWPNIDEADIKMNGSMSHNFKDEPEVERCLICYSFMENGSVQCSYKVFASLSSSLNNRKQLEVLEEFSDSLMDMFVFCFDCYSLMENLYAAKMKLDDIEKNFKALLLKIQTRILLSTASTENFQIKLNEESHALDKISIRDKINYFRRAAVKEFTPSVRLFREGNFFSLKVRRWRTPHENSIFKLVKDVEIKILHPEIAFRTVQLTEEEQEQYLKWENGKFSCRLCHYSYKCYKAAVRHCNKVHKQITRFQCRYCPQQFYERHEAALHIVDAHKTERVELAAEIQDAILKSKTVKMTSESGVIELQSNKSTKLLPENSIIKIGSRWKCTICLAVYKNRCVALKHQKAVHLNFYRFKCEFCDFKSYRKDGVSLHFKRVHAEKVDGEKYKNLPLLKSKRIRRPRIKTDLNNMQGIKLLEIKETPKTDDYIAVVDSRYACKICGSQFVSRLSVVNHVECAHFGVRNYECLTCHKKFFRLEITKRHIKKQHPNVKSLNEADGETIKRADTKVETTTPFDFNSQCEDMEEMQVEDPLSVNVQTQKVKEEVAVDIPLNEHVKIDILPSFANNFQVFSPKHNQQHFSEFSDDTNDRSERSVAKSTPRVYEFILPGNIIEMAKNPNYEEEYQNGYRGTENGIQCLRCDKIVKNIKVFRHHWANFHDKSGGYQCSICRKRYSAKFPCAVHYLSRHTNHRPFVCNVCDKSFTTNSDLKMHARHHFGERAFACDACPLKFLSKKLMERHFKFVHMKTLDV